MYRSASCPIRGPPAIRRYRRNRLSAVDYDHRRPTEGEIRKTRRREIRRRRRRGEIYLHQFLAPPVACWRRIAGGRFLLPTREEGFSAIFGVVLLELLTGWRSVDKTRPSKEQSLVDWARPKLNDKRKLLQIIDTRLEDQYSVRAAQKACSLAYYCLSHNPKARPLMSDVVETLEPLQVSSGSEGLFQAVGSSGISGYKMHRRLAGSGVSCRATPKAKCPPSSPYRSVLAYRDLAGTVRYGSVTVDFDRYRVCSSYRLVQDGPRTSKPLDRYVPPIPGGTENLGFNCTTADTPNFSLEL
ncbi:hypothetical protein BHM03_00038223 [Ensete ventricosum]|nr:hypothetical protein BHM03_00038223 [Ensete ventricosum]